MTHSKIYRIFVEKFPQFYESTAAWFPNGKNSIRVRLSNGQDFIFTHNSTDDWCFETVDSFIRRLKGEREM